MITKIFNWLCISFVVIIPTVILTLDVYELFINPDARIVLYVLVGTGTLLYMGVNGIKLIFKKLGVDIL